MVSGLLPFTFNFSLVRCSNPSFNVLSSVYTCQILPIFCGVTMTIRHVRRRKLHAFVVDQIEEAILPRTLSNDVSLPSERNLMETISVG